MDIFNTKKIAALEARIAALEPQHSYVGQYVTTTSTEPKSEKPTLEALEKRIKKVEDEVFGDYVTFPSLMRLMYSREPEKKLTLRDRVDRICEHLKITFVTEPQRTVIKPVKAKR